jgi:hypothetical protein
MKLNIALMITTVALATYGGAQDYSIRSHSINNGGGTGTGGPYRLTGSIGQVDAGNLLQDNTPDQAPVLKIASTNANTAVAVSWPADTGGYSINGGFWTLPRPSYVLEESTEIGSTNWQSVMQTLELVGTNKVVVTPSTQGNRFYRLKK